MGKCGDCGIPGGDKNFHICVDLSYKAPGEGLLNAPKKKAYTMTEEHRQNLRASSQIRWERQRQQQSRG